MSKTKKRAKVEYAWRDGWRGPVNAQVAGEELARIRDDHGGALDPAEVVEESRPEEAPLHPHFEWDDERAAELYREEQARGVIRGIRVVEAGSDGSVPPTTRIGYVCVEQDDDRGRVYVDSSRAMGDADLRRQVLAEALTALRGVRRRYAHQTELSKVFAEIDAVADDVA